DQGEEEDMFGIAPPSPRTMGRVESAPSEEPTQSGTTIDTPVGITVTAVPRPRQGVAFSVDPSRPSLQPVGNARGDVPMVTPAYATSDRRTCPVKAFLPPG
ncbi:hypothetical protein PC110_g20986, partial [Phytophthora cactorum]